LLFFPAVAADYDANYTTNPINAIREVINATTNELVMRPNIAELTVTFTIVTDIVLEEPEIFFLFLEGTRSVFVLTPMVTVTILDSPFPSEFTADFSAVL